MPEGQGRESVTGSARWIAAARARESARPDALFSDPWAGDLAGEEGRARLAASEQASGRENTFLPIRTRFFDDVLIGAPWAEQVVLLGAGMDTRAYRLGLAGTVTVFELDHDVIFTLRREVLRDAAPTCRRVEVAADLTQDWASLLLAAGLDRDRPTLWLAEGVLFYLTADAVRRLLATASELSRSRALFGADIFGTGLLQLDGMRPLLDNRRRTGRPVPFCTDHPSGLLTAAGWRVQSLTEPGPLLARYGRLPEDPPAARPPADPTMRTYLALGTKP